MKTTLWEKSELGIKDLNESALEKGERKYWKTNRPSGYNHADKLGS